ncbi:MAG TPA: fibronectin type III domain-containing protein, partial [Anaerolineales bacterium]|nr:fibronectin type III domain-containing protein [Anaerolineales bacterium]
DTISPSKPTNVTATATDSNMVALSWKASTDNVGVTGYDIYRDGALLTTVPPVTSYNDGTVQPDTTYSYRIRARDAAGKVSSLSSAASVTTPGLLFSDGFESGNFLQWTTVSNLVLQQQEVYAGTRAVQALSSGTPTYAYEQLSQTQNELYYRLWFKISSKGANPVVLQRFRSAAANNASIMTVSVTSAGKLSIRNDVAGVSTASTTAVTNGVWHQLQTRILVNGAAGETEVWFDGVRLDSLSKTENFATTPVGRIQLGETTSGRTYNMFFDRVALSTNFIDPADPPEGTPPPTNTPTVTPTATPTATATQPANQVGVNVWVGNSQPGSHTVPKGQARQVTYTGVNTGPVKMMSTSADPLVGSEAALYSLNGTVLSFSELMGLPNSQLDNLYWFPWYNNKDLDTQLRFANVSNTTATVHVTIGGQPVSGSPFSLTPGASIRKSFPGIDRGPVKIESNVNIVAAERVIHKVNGVPTSYSELMGLPASQLDNLYWFPWYNNKDLNTQLRIANVSSSTATVHVTIGGQPVSGSPFSLTPGASIRKSFPGIDRGPVKIESNVNIVAAERVIYKVNGADTSFTELMALPAARLSTTYWLPWYNSVDMDTQLRFANVSNSTASVQVFIGGQPMVGSPFTLTPGASKRISFAGINTGPVKIVSTQTLVAAERVIYKVNNIPTSFSEMLALPHSLLNTTHWLPWYNNVDLASQLRFAAP